MQNNNPVLFIEINNSNFIFYVIKHLEDKISITAKQWGLPIEPTKKVLDLSVGEQQRVEIIRCLLQNPKLLIMDEPTSVLSPQEINQLFKEDKNEVEIVNPISSDLNVLRSSIFSNLIIYLKNIRKKLLTFI